MSRDNELFIDLLRGIAAVLVFVSHVVSPALMAMLGEDKELWSAGWQLVGATAGSGGFWVRCFFVISGLCIHLSIMRSLDAGGFRLGSYFMARLTRIYPMFLVALAVALVASFFVGTWADLKVHQVVGSIFMLQYFTGTVEGFDPSWSLTPEMLYYLVWPLALLALGSARRAVVFSALGAILFTLVVVMFWKLWLNGNPNHWLVPLWVTSGLYVLWLGGAALASAWKRIQEWTTAPRWWMALAWVCGAYALNAFLITVSARTWMHMALDYAALPGFLILIAGGHHLKLSSHRRLTVISTWMGCLSYPCYLLHEPLIHLLRPLVRVENAGLQALIVALITMGVIVTAGVAMERRFLSWRKQLLSSERARRETHPIPA